jgi:LytS/YehU family sensor histidine kinase
MLYPLAGLDDFDYGRMPLRYFMEAPMQLIGFAVMVGAVHGFHGLRRARERAVRTALLETSLAQAQLRALRLQLQPHFLFNALNTISATMYRDPAAADEILDQLAELLRAALRTAQTDEVPLGEELGILDCYLGILRARFGERLRLATRLEDGLERALVPSLLLQPLVENAVRHGRVESQGTGAITIAARRVDGRLVLEVEDDGPGAPPGRDPLASGVGLAATAERLQLLYGERQRLEVASPPGGGFQVRVSLPLRWAS